MSSRSKPWSTLTHCLPRVTPGRFWAMALFRLATLLMKVDLPTLGTPTTMTRTGRPDIPFSAHLLFDGVNPIILLVENNPNCLSGQQFELL